MRGSPGDKSQPSAWAKWAFGIVVLSYALLNTVLFELGDQTSSAVDFAALAGIFTLYVLKISVLSLILVAVLMGRHDKPRFWSAAALTSVVFAVVSTLLGFITGGL